MVGQAGLSLGKYTERKGVGGGGGGKSSPGHISSAALLGRRLPGPNLARDGTRNNPRRKSAAANVESSQFSRILKRDW